MLKTEINIQWTIFTKNEPCYTYPRVTTFDALNQSTDICAHLITFSSSKYITLNKLSCFQSKLTFWEVRERLFCLKYRCQRV